MVISTSNLVEIFMVGTQHVTHFLGQWVN